MSKTIVDTEMFAPVSVHRSVPVSQQSSEIVRLEGEMEYLI